VTSLNYFLLRKGNEKSKAGKPQTPNMYADHFSIQNIPFGIASSASHPEKAVATRFEDSVLFLDELVSAGLLNSLSEGTKKAFSQVSEESHCSEIPAPQRNFSKAYLLTKFSQMSMTSRLFQNQNKERLALPSKPSSPKG
jgi:hypothetical protein